MLTNSNPTPSCRLSSSSRYSNYS